MASNTKVSMGLTESDIDNVEYVTSELNLVNKADGVSWALSVARSIIEKSREQQTSIIIRDEKTGHNFKVRLPGAVT